MLQSSKQNPKNGRIIASGLLTDQQATFAKNYSSGLSGAESARLAGYSNGASESYRLLLLPHIQEAIRQEQTRAINLDGARLAWRTMVRLMEDEEISAQVQFQAARWTLEAAGQGIANRALKAGLSTGGKALNEMSQGELEEFIAQGREALARAEAIEVASEVIDHAPIEQIGQVIESELRHENDTTQVVE